MLPVQTICLLGAESTGKSTLAEHLAREYDTCFVEEQGRAYWVERSGRLVQEDYLIIAKKQIECEELARGKANRFLFADTSPLTTLFYSLSDTGRADDELVKLSFRSYSRILLCAPDIPFVQDGTRTSDEFRQKQHLWYQNQLIERGVAFTLLKGSLAHRIQTVRLTLESLC